MVTLSCLAALLYTINALLVYVSCKEKVVKFDAKPVGQLLEEKVKLGNIICTFAYKSVGGTNENWELKLVREKKSVLCTAARPSQSSYLFFMAFSLTLEGASVTKTELYGNSMKPLASNEYKMEGNSVKNAEGFKSNLVAVNLMATKRAKKDEM